MIVRAMIGYQDQVSPSFEIAGKIVNGKAYRMESLPTTENVAVIIDRNDEQISALGHACELLATIIYTVNGNTPTDDVNFDCNNFYLSDQSMLHEERRYGSTKNYFMQCTGWTGNRMANMDWKSYPVYTEGTNTPATPQTGQKTPQDSTNGKVLEVLNWGFSIETKTGETFFLKMR